jgi:hypothetical protein
MLLRIRVSSNLCLKYISFQCTKIDANIGAIPNRRTVYRMWRGRVFGGRQIVQLSQMRGGQIVTADFQTTEQRMRVLVSQHRLSQQLSHPVLHFTDSCTPAPEVRVVRLPAPSVSLLPVAPVAIPQFVPFNNIPPFPQLNPQFSLYRPA